eukprot:scaffold88743_cov54-Phaeocystis_antarctica.AAC.3
MRTGRRRHRRRGDIGGAHAHVVALDHVDVTGLEPASPASSASEGSVRSSSLTASAATIRAPPTTVLGPTTSPSMRAANPAAHRGSVLRMTEASTAGSRLKMDTCSQMVAAVPHSPV